MERLERLFVPFEVKEASEADGFGRFTGLASVYGNVDHHGEVVLPGAFKTTLREQGATRPLLWQHDMADPVGLVELEDAQQGLVAKGAIDLDIPQGKRAYFGVKKRYVTGLSIGYDTVKDALNRDTGVRELHEIRLWEVSLVTIPANPLAQVTAAKALQMVQRLSAADSLEVAIKHLDALREKRAALADNERELVRELVKRLHGWIGEEPAAGTSADEDAEAVAGIRALLGEMRALASGR